MISAASDEELDMALARANIIMALDNTYGTDKALDDYDKCLSKQKNNAIDECIELMALIIRDVEENDISLKIEDLDGVLEKLQQAKGNINDNEK